MHLNDNLAQLPSAQAALRARILESPDGRFSLVPSREGSPSAQCEGQWIHSAYDPKREAASWAAQQLPEWRAGELAVVLGVGLLYHVEALVARAPAGHRVAVAVPDLSVLRAAFEARPLGAWIGSIEWIDGTPDSMADRLAQIGMPLRLMTYAPAARIHADLHRGLEDALRRKLAAQTSGRLHVAVVGPIYGGSLPIARYVVTALEALGHRVSWIDHSVHHASYDMFGTYREPKHRQMMQGRIAEMLGLSTVVHLAEDPPDLVLAIAQAPLTLSVLEHLRKKKFLTAMWFVENYRHLTYWQQLAGGYDHWFVIQRQGCVETLKRAGAPHVHYLPMAADPNVHRPIALSDAERREFGADVSFVGAGYRNRRILLPQWLSKDWTFKLWGNEWEGAEALAAVLQRGGARIDTDTCMKVFNATAVNLNLHSSGGEALDDQPDFVNPRTFELAACGAFQLVDERSLLADLFTDHEVVRFNRPDEVPGLVRRWLGDGAGRRAAAEAARARVLRDHTYEQRMGELLATIGCHQPDRIGAVLRGARNAGRLAERASASPVLEKLLKQYPPDQRVELKDLATRIRTRGPGHRLERDELLILLLDSYRAEMRDLV